MMELKVTIEKLVNKAEGLARYDGKVLFVYGSLADEVVTIKISEEKKDFLRGELVQVERQSPLRRVAPCQYYNICGGCDLQHLKDEYQAEAKLEIVKENLERIGKLDLAEVEISKSSKAPMYAYRNRVRFHVDLENKKVGFLERKSDNLVDIENCLILAPLLNECLNVKRETLFDIAKQRESNKRYVEIAAFCGDNEVTFDEREVEVTVLGKTLHVNANVFFQSNRYLLEELLQFISDNVKGSTVYDLYAGIGTFSAFIEKPELKTVAVESNKNSLTLAKKNLKHTQFINQSVESWAKKTKIKGDTVIVDPPRVGLSKSSLEAINKIKPKQIIYVSCDSVTLSRDCNRFNELGYKVEEVKVFDFYPQTSHIETVVVLSL